MSLPVRIAVAALHRGERHHYGSHPAQVADLHVPAGPGPHPVAVVLHGGSWEARYGRGVMRPLCLDLAAGGWAAWNLEYRRVGRGQDGGWPATFEDVAAGADALVALKDPRLDLGRVALVGHSAGGQLALWVATRDSLPPGAPGAGPVLAPRAVVALAPVTSMRTTGRTAWAVLGGGPEAVPERYALTDPLARLPLQIPALVVHGGRDSLVSPVRSREYVAAAQAAGGEAELVEIAAADHVALIDPSGPGWRAARSWLGRTSA